MYNYSVKYRKKTKKIIPTSKQYLLLKKKKPKTNKQRTNKKQKQKKKTLAGMIAKILSAPNPRSHSLSWPQRVLCLSVFFPGVSVLFAAGNKRYI